MPITPPGPSRSTAQIVLRNGDLVEGDLLIANIEDAALASDGSAAAVVTIADSGNQAAIVVRRPDGSVEVAFDPRDDASSEVNAASISRLRLAPGGETVFQSGTGLDSDRLHRIIDGRLETIAGAPPGPVFPEFRILGNVRIGEGGRVAFVGGGDECQVVLGDDTPRVTCTNILWIADQDGVARIDEPTLELGNQRPTAIRVELDPAGGAWYSLPRRGSAPMLLHYADGEARVVLTPESELPEVGKLNSAEAVAINAAGQVLLEAVAREFVGERRPQVLGVLDGDQFRTIARGATELGGANVVSVRGLGIDAAGRALFEARLGDPDVPASQRNSLWLGNADELTEIVREGEPMPGEEISVLTINGSRVNAAGDVAFVTQLGSITDGVERREEVRATVRRADGRLVTVASSRHTGQFGVLSAMQIAGWDESATLLLLGSRSRSSDRVLLMGRSDPDED